MRAARSSEAALRAAARWTFAALAWGAAACGTDVVHLDGTAHVPPPRPECVSIPQAAGQACIYCGASYAQQRACLKCQGADPSTSCSLCQWSDSTDPNAVCKKCTDATGAISLVGCSELRTDLLVPGA